MTNTLVNRLIQHEGLKLEPYHCTAGKLTIGVGRNLQDVGITKNEAIYLLNNDIAVCTGQCEQSFDFFASLDKTRQEVMIEMCFNLGINRLKGFKKMLAAVQDENYTEAASQMLDSTWARQVGNRATTLANLMKTGV